MLMHGFPPPANGQVTLANWQEPPFNRWSFSHMRELVPTQRISRGPGPVTSLPVVRLPLGKTMLHRVDGAAATVDEVFEETYTDAVVVVHGGRVVLERYAGETAPDTPHLLMSVSKSVVGCIAGNLVERGLLSSTDLVTDHVPELEHSGYRGASLRDVLDMRSGVEFSEDYTDLNAEVRVMEEAMGWRPASHRKLPCSMYAYLTTLGRAGEHGGVFDYRSCETDVLGWVCERATNTRMADLISELVWAPMGAEHDAEITCDGVGTAIHDGGMCATARDLTRFGLVLLAEGEIAGRRIAPVTWLRESWTVTPDIRGAFARSVSGPYLPGGWYRNKFWFLPREHGDVLLCLGIHGQMLYVSPGTGTVAAKLSSWPDAQSPTMLHDTLRAFDAVGAALASTAAGDPALRHGPAGVVAGVSRGRSAGRPVGGGRDRS
jgi:CubicO group peptidase (beta-lactamase class C family)